MPTIEQTVDEICRAPSLDARVAEIRKIPGRHGTDDWQRIYAEVARELYVPALTPDFAYIHPEEFYSAEHFRRAYEAASAGTGGFAASDPESVARTLRSEPVSLLAFRVITGLTREELAHSTTFVAATPRVTGAAIDGHERHGTAMDPERADLLARAICGLVTGSLLPRPATDEIATKQAIKSDTAAGWGSVAEFAAEGVPYWMLLHQRHYGGAFRQLLDATSTKRGDLIEDAVEELFRAHAIPYLRTGSHNQGDIARRFGLQVRPAPDFVLFDERSGTLQAILECKGANDGGTARDKALRFERLRQESGRLGGVPVMAVLGGIGWRRVNDTLGHVLAQTEGRVFTLATLPQMLTVAPLTTLAGTASRPGGGDAGR